MTRCSCSILISDSCWSSCRCSSFFFCAIKYCSSTTRLFLVSCSLSILFRWPMAYSSQVCDWKLSWLAQNVANKFVEVKRTRSFSFSIFSLWDVRTSTNDWTVVVNCSISDLERKNVITGVRDMVKSKDCVLSTKPVHSFANVSVCL